MSTATRRPRADALADADAFRALFSPDTYARWEIAGSIRRGKPDVGDVEHLVIPAFGDAPTGGLFAERVNLLHYEMDRMVKEGTISRAIYANGQQWGEKKRGVSFRGHTHEVYVANADNWGSKLVILTGPAEFSKAMVTRLHDYRRRNHESYVWDCVPCESCQELETPNYTCRQCEGTNLIPTTKLVTPDEEEYFKCCGAAFVKPEDRR